MNSEIVELSFVRSELIFFETNANLIFFMEIDYNLFYFEF